jgi:hypothetical protein
MAPYRFLANRAAAILRSSYRIHHTARASAHVAASKRGNQLRARTIARNVPSHRMKMVSAHRLPATHLVASRRSPSLSFATDVRRAFANSVKVI